MLSPLKHADAKREGGFTLIELLVVVIIIGILAAIAIPVFLAQRERAWRSAAQSDLRNAAVSMETYFTDNGFYGPGALTSGFGFNPTATVQSGTAFGDVAGPGAQSWCMIASHESHAETWFLGSGGTLSQTADGTPAGCGATGLSPALPTP